MNWCLEDVLLLLLEVPTANGLLFDLLLRLVILVLPRGEHLFTKLDLSKTLLRVLLLKDLIQLNLVLDFLADLG